jgi:DNA-binding SARP family transcriptional activator
VRIGLLGDLVIDTGGRTRRITAGKHRSLFAALAVAPDQTVPASAIAEAIWDGTPPPSWAVTLRNYVKHLRRLLGSRDEHIITSSPGYRLHVSPSDEIDLTKFEALGDVGHRAAASGEWPRASAALSSALALWRGTPFTDVPSRLIRDAYLPYLEQARLAALTTRIHADLQVLPAGAAPLIAELQRLVRGHPLHERFRAQLMLALHLAGRPGDALAAYTEARNAIIAELGIEPGRDLTEMHRRILARDPSLWPVRGPHRGFPAMGHRH